jgi:hypothetical protein
VDFFSVKSEIIIYYQNNIWSREGGEVELFWGRFRYFQKKLFLGIKSGAEGSKIELFWGGFI